MKRVLLIVNPNAGQTRSRTNLFNIVNTLSLYGMLPTVYITKGKSDAKSFVSENGGNYDAVICCGGDGTLNETINGMIGRCDKVPLGYIPSGSTNDFASSFGISTDPVISSKSIALGTEMPIDVGCFNNSSYFTYVASFGAFTKASYNTPQHIKNALGHAAYIIEGAKMISEIKPFFLKCRCDDTVIEGKFLFGAVLNSTSVAGIKLLDEQGVKFNDGLFELFLVRFPENLAQTKQTLDDFILKNYGSQSIIMQRGKSFSFEFEQPTAFSLDGEYGEEHLTATVTVKSGAIKFLNR